MSSVSIYVQDERPIVRSEVQTSWIDIDGTFSGPAIMFPGDSGGTRLAAWVADLTAQLASHPSAGQRALDRMTDAARVGRRIPVELAANLALYHDGGIEWTFTLAPEGEPTRTEIDAIAQLVETFGEPKVDSHSGVQERHHDLRWTLDGDVTICGWGARDYVVAGSFRLPGVAV